MAKLLSRWISDTPYLNILSFMIIFCGILIIISILGIIIKYLLKIAFLGWVDRICGAAFGMIKGVLIVSVIILALTTFMPAKSPLIGNSHLAPHVMFLSEALIKVVPEKMKEEFFSKINELKKVWEERH